MGSGKAYLPWVVVVLTLVAAVVLAWQGSYPSQEGPPPERVPVDRDDSSSRVAAEATGDSRLGEKPRRRRLVAAPATPPAEEPGPARPPITGKVVAASTGKPIANARVVHYAGLKRPEKAEPLEKYGPVYSKLPPLAAVTTDAKGCFDLGPRPDRHTWLLVSAKGWATVPVRVWAQEARPAGKEGLPWIIPLVRPLAVAGTAVLQESGTPVADVEVHVRTGGYINPGYGEVLTPSSKGDPWAPRCVSFVEEADWGEGGHRLLFTHSVQADGYGRFRLSDLDPRLGWVLSSTGGFTPLTAVTSMRCRFGLPTQCRYSAQDVDVDPGKPGDLDLELSAEERIKVCLKLADGCDSTGLTDLWVSSAYRWEVPNPRVRRWSDVSGTRSFPFPSSGVLVLARAAESHNRLVILAGRRGAAELLGVGCPKRGTMEDQSITVELAPLTRIRGRVRDESGRPLAGVVVTHEPGYRIWIAAASPPTETDPLGEFEVRDHAGKHTSIRLRKEGYADGLLSLKVPAPSPARPVQDVVLLRRAGVISGRVVDDRGRPVPLVVVGFSMVGCARHAQYHAMADSEGRFRLGPIPYGRYSFVCQPYARMDGGDRTLLLTADAPKKQVTIRARR